MHTIAKRVSSPCIYQIRGVAPGRLGVDPQLLRLYAFGSPPVMSHAKGLGGDAVLQVCIIPVWVLNDRERFSLFWPRASANDLHPLQRQPVFKDIIHLRRFLSVLHIYNGLFLDNST